MGNFSWISNDGIQIKSEPISQTVKMVYKENNQVKIAIEENYEGYGVFGGVDYYNAVCLMNNLPLDRGNGIDFCFGNNKENAEFPQFYLLDVPQKIDFSKEPLNDPNQGWNYEDEN